MEDIPEIHTPKRHNPYKAEKMYTGICNNVPDIEVLVRNTSITLAAWSLQ